MSDSEESDPEKRFEHIADCPRCLREFWEEHIPLEEENSRLRAEVHKLRTQCVERATSDAHFEHNRLMSPEFAAIKAEILSRTGWKIWHLDVNYHIQLVFLQVDPADAWSVCYMDVFPAPDYTQVIVKTRTFYAEYHIPLDDPKAIHPILDGLFDPSSPNYIPENKNRV